MYILRVFRIPVNQEKTKHPPFLQTFAIIATA